VLDSSKDEQSEMKPLFNLIYQRSENVRTVASSLKGLHEKNMLKHSISGLMSSYIHMMINRIFRSKQRLNEFVVYALLYRHYKSAVARGNKS